jgi:hypothetical protein
MATLKDATGANEIECQSCHGNTSAVGASGRQGWLQEPACQMCHTGTAVSNNGQIVYTSVFTSGTTQRVAVDQTFATNANVPSSGLSLYRYSAGHGGLQCEACHNSTHAEYTSSGGSTQCQTCHGTDYRGTILSKTKVDRTLAGRSFPAGTVIGCYSCHNGPSGG